MQDLFCINIKYLCDGFYDCYDKSDEMNCPENSTLNRFLCNDHSQLIGTQLVCDFIKDCKDGSDEIDCSS